MSSNTISINLEPEYNVPDSKMEKLLKFLRKNAYLIDKDTKDKLTSKHSRLFAYSD